MELSFAVGNRESRKQEMLRQMTRNRADDRCIADFTCLHARQREIIRFSRGRY